MLEQKSKFNLSIHGLRGLAAILVVLFHVYGMGSKNDVLWQHFDWVKPIGPFFVSIFFAISGYLITQTLEKHNSLRVFTKNRIARIYPVFLVLHLIMFTLGPGRYDWMKDLNFGSIEYLKAFVSNLLFLPGVFDIPIAQKNAWSLSYEALFYILAGIVWKTSTIRTKSTKFVLLLIEAVAIVVSAYTWISNSYCMSFFLIGTGCYFIQKYYNDRVVSTHQFGSISIIIAGFLYGYNPLFSLPFVGIFFIEIVREDGFFSHLLRLRPMNFLGTISYSLYLIHPFVMDLVRSIAVKIATAGYQPIGDLTLIVLGPLLSISVAWISYELIERRLTKSIFAKL